MRNKEKEIVAALVSAEEIKEDTKVEIPQPELKKRPRRRLGRRLGAINYMSGSDIHMPFTVRF